MIDRSEAQRFVDSMPWGEVPKPVLFIMLGPDGPNTTVHLHTTVRDGWKNKVHLHGRTAEGTLGCALERWIEENAQGDERADLLAAVRKLLN